MNTDLLVIASRIQTAWEAGKVCSLVGRGCRARVVRLGRLAEAGRIEPGLALQLAREAEALAFCFLPLPAEAPDDHR
jgi:hypothetical protein